MDSFIRQNEEKEEDKIARSSGVDGRRGQKRAALPNHTIDIEKRLVSVTFQKKVTIAEIKRYAASLRMDPLFEPDFSEIADMRQVEELDLKADEFIRLADEIDPFSLKAKRAFVAGNSVQNHAARMHKILRSQRNFEIFQSVEAAERWIRS
jgi:hypothetical protein